MSNRNTEWHPHLQALRADDELAKWCHELLKMHAHGSIQGDAPWVILRDLLEKRDRARSPTPPIASNPPTSPVHR